MMKKAMVYAVLLAMLLTSCVRGDGGTKTQRGTETVWGGAGREHYSETVTAPQELTTDGSVDGKVNTDAETTDVSDTDAGTADVSATDAATEDTTEADVPITDAVTADGAFAPLDALLTAPPVDGASVAFYLEDLESGISYAFNAHVPTYSASLIKLPYVLALLAEAQTRDMGFDEVFTFTGTEDTFGSGEIKNAPVGTEYTILELMEYSLRFSDNVAFWQLRQRYGMEIYFDYARSIGAHSLAEWDGWVLTARDGGTVLKKAYEYIEGDHLYSKEIKEAMISSAHSIMLSPGLSGKSIARKYGWDDRAYHDMGIVYGEHPYVMVFLSDMTSGSAEVNAYISTVAAVADGIIASLYGEGEKNP